MRKTIERERLEIPSRKLEIPKEHFIQDGQSERQKEYRPKRSRRD